MLTMDTSVARKTNIPDFATAYYLLEGLNEISVDYLFCNFGTDHAPIIDEMAHRRRRGEPMPTIVRCPHENTAAHHDHVWPQPAMVADPRADFRRIEPHH